MSVPCSSRMGLAITNTTTTNPTRNTSITTDTISNEDRGLVLPLARHLSPTGDVTWRRPPQLLRQLQELVANSRLIPFDQQESTTVTGGRDEIIQLLLDSTPLPSDVIHLICDYRLFLRTPIYLGPEVGPNHWDTRACATITDTNLMRQLLTGDVSIRAIIGWSNQYANGVQFVYGPNTDLSNNMDLFTQPNYTTSMLAVGSHDHPIETRRRLRSDEFITHVIFYAGMFGDSLSFVTSRTLRMDEAGRPIYRKIRFGRSLGGQRYEFRAPKNGALIGLFYGRGGHMHNLAPVFATFNQSKEQVNEPSPTVPLNENESKEQRTENTNERRVEEEAEVENDIGYETEPDDADDDEDQDITPPTPALIGVEPNPGPGQTELTPSSIDSTHPPSSTSTNSAGGSSSLGRNLTSTLSLSLMGRCLAFLNLKDLHAGHSVSQFFRQASEHQSTWDEGQISVATGQLSISSPRTHLQFPSNNLVSLCASSFGRSLRWLEIDLASAEMKDVPSFVACHPQLKLHGLIIKNLTRIEYRPWFTSIMDQPAIWTQLSSFSLTSSLRVLSIGVFSPTFLIRLLPIIGSMLTLTTVELELQPTGEPYILPTTFATHLSKLVSLHLLILSDENYRYHINEDRERSESSEEDVCLSNSSLVQLAHLLHALPHLKLELNVFLACATLFPDFRLLQPCTDPATLSLPRITTLVIRLRIEVHDQLAKLFSYFPDLIHVIDLSARSGWALLKHLPPSVMDLTLVHLHGLTRFTDDEDQLIKQYDRRFRRLRVGSIQSTKKSLKVFKRIFRDLEELEHLQLRGWNKYNADWSDILLSLYPKMNKVRMCVLHWTSVMESQMSTENMRKLFANLPPTLVKVQVRQVGSAQLACAYEARELLRLMPRVKEVKWNDEPWLPLERIESYYSWENIAKRSNSTNTIEPIPTVLQQITSASLPTLPPFTLNILSLTLIFQFLSLKDLFSAHRVCRSYRVAAVSPLVQRPNIHVRMDRLAGAVVSGTKISFSSIAPMKSAVRSMLFQNIRILTLPLPLASSFKPNPRQPGLYHYHLNRFELIPYFHSLHTLSLDWSVLPDPFILPSGRDEELIDCVLQSSSLKHLKVLRLLMPPRYLEWLLPKTIHSLAELEVIELRTCALPHNYFMSPSHFLASIPFHLIHQWSHIKHFCLFRDTQVDRTTKEDLDELVQLFQLMNPPLESVVWGPVIYQDLIQELVQRPLNQLPILAPMHSITLALSEGIDDLSFFDTLMRVFPDLHHLHFNRLLLSSPAASVTFPIRLSIQLESLNLRYLSLPTALLMMEAISECAKSVPDAWTNLKQFGVERNESVLFKTFLPTDHLAPFLQAATNLTDLSLEGVQFALDLEPQPWIARLRIFQHSDPPQLNRLIPLATNLVEFRSNDPGQTLTGIDFLGLLVERPGLESCVFRGEVRSRAKIEETLAEEHRCRQGLQKLKEASLWPPIQVFGMNIQPSAPVASSSSFMQPITTGSFTMANETKEEEKSDLDDTHLIDIFHKLITSLHTTTTATIEEQKDAKLSPTPLKCWMTLQPITNLALICRYLNPPELLAVDKTCRHLSAAASHPLTFQQETEVGVEVDLYHCRSYARGPVGVFTANVEKMRRAFQSRLFKHFRIIQLRASGPEEPVWFPDTLSDWLTCLMESITPIRALTLQLTHQLTWGFIFGPSDEDRVPVDALLTRFSADKSMAYLTSLHLELGVWLKILLPHLPPSLQILHLTLTEMNNNIESLIDGILASPAANSIRTYIFDPSKYFDGADTSTSDLEQLARLAASQPQLEAIEWRFLMDLTTLMDDLTSDEMEPNTFPRIPQLHTILLSSTSDTIFHQEATYDYLAMFPNLTRLVIHHSAHFSQSFKQHLWSRCTQLAEIRCTYSISDAIYEPRSLALMIDGLAAARLSQLQTLVVGDIRLTDLLLTLPNLTSLRCHRLDNIIELDDRLLDTGIALIQQVVPSLTELRLDLSPLQTLYSSTFLRSIPQLKRIRWHPIDWMNAHEAIIQSIQDEAKAMFEAKQPFLMESPALNELQSALDEFTIHTPMIGGPTTTPKSSLFKSKPLNKKGKR